MKVLFASNDYFFKSDKGAVLDVRMGYTSGVGTVEFMLNGTLIYYFLLNEDMVENLNDLEIINLAIETMEADTGRWIEDCNPYLNSRDTYILSKRVTVYRVIYDDAPNHIATVTITEEDGDNFKIEMRDELGGTYVVTKIRAENREYLISSMEVLFSGILDMLQPFRDKQETIILTEFGKDYILQRQISRKQG